MDSRELRNCFGKFATGVTIVTWEGEDRERCGITVNSLVNFYEPGISSKIINRVKEG